MGDVGKEVRRLREAKGWGQTKLAAAADMAVSGVSQIENGRRNPNSATLIKLARALEVEVRDLFPLAQSPLPEPPHTRRFGQIEQAARALDTAWRREVARNEFSEAEYQESGQGLKGLDNLLADTMFEPFGGAISEERQEIFNEALRKAAAAVDSLRATLARARAAHRDRTLKERGVPQIHEFHAPRATELLRMDEARRSEAG